MYPYIILFGMYIPLYGLCMSVGITFSFYIAWTEARHRRLNSNSLIIIAACVVGIGLIGAKLLYLIVSSDVCEILIHLCDGDISDFTNGGQVFYGGLIGGIGGALIGQVVAGEKEHFSEYCDAIVLSVPIGHAFGRLGCFFAGCCYGAPYSGIFAIAFPKEGVFESVFPVQRLEAVLNIGLYLLLVRVNRKPRQDFLLPCMYINNILSRSFCNRMFSW